MNKHTPTVGDRDEFIRPHCQMELIKVMNGHAHCIKSTGTTRTPFWPVFEDELLYVPPEPDPGFSPNTLFAASHWAGGGFITAVLKDQSDCWG